MQINNMLDEMRQLGFSEYEAKCYLALFERSSLSVNEIAKLSGIPRPSAYDVLDKLTAKGLVSITSGKTKRFAVSNPRLLREISLNTLESELKELDRKRERIINSKKAVQDNIDSIVSQLESRYNDNRNNGDPLEYIEILKNKCQIHNKYIELYSKAQKEVLGFVKPPFSWVTEKQAKEQNDVQREGAKRGVVKKIILERPPENKAIEYFAKMKFVAKNKDERMGTIYDEFKVINELPIKLFVFDSKTCFFTLENPIKDESLLTMLVAEHEALAKTFKFVFEAFWKDAQDYYVVDGKKYNLFDPEEYTADGGDE